MMKYVIWGLLCPLFISMNAYAGVNKIYDPYVHEGETEVEFWGVHSFDDENVNKVKFAVAHGMTSFWLLEGVVEYEQETGNKGNISAVEVENKFQLTEQGKYWLDVGVLTELEKSTDGDVWEFKAGPIFQKQISRWILTTNFLLERKFGSDNTDHRVDVLGNAQLKYPYSPELQPAIEYYGDRETHSIGPVLLGKHLIGSTPMKWELGALAGLNDAGPDFTLRWLVEWEFY